MKLKHFKKKTGKNSLFYPFTIKTNIKTYIFAFLICRNIT